MAIIKEDNSTTSYSNGAAEARARSWSKVFAKKNIDPAKAIQCITDNVTPMLLEKNQLPKQSHMKNCLKRAKPSAPGSDGIPYSAWKTSGITGSVILHKARTMMNGI